MVEFKNRCFGIGNINTKKIRNYETTILFLFDINNELMSTSK